jgi:hypothetical protein
MFRAFHRRREWIRPYVLIIFPQRFTLALVKPPMNRIWHRFRMNNIGIADVLRAGAILATILMIAAFFSGCVTERIDSEGRVIRKRQPDHASSG